MVLWASPKRGEEDMDHLFFETLFRYLDEGTKTGWLDPLQMMLLKYVLSSKLFGRGGVLMTTAVMRAHRP